MPYGCPGYQDVGRWLTAAGAFAARITAFPIRADVVVSAAEAAGIGGRVR